MKALSIEQLVVDYKAPHGQPPLNVVDHIDLELEGGDFVVIVGPSGCGKSSLLRVAAGLVEPTSGRVLVGGKLADRPGADRGVVFQSYSLYEWRTVLGNVEFGLELAGWGKKERRNRARDLIRLVGLDGFEDVYPRRLSGGMQQRVALARALAPQPTVLLLDEPFGALDAQTRTQMQELLLNVWREVKTTILFITHDLDEALFLADRVFMMSRRPGRWLKVLNVDLPRPRTYEITTSAMFCQYKTELLSMLRQEAAAAEGP
ncbi:MULTISPECIES: ABC transporter ATP-binding protein [unclassified Caballeronia]|uniref:ABC transporter ATP-binding protein n=1 Tax=unclassified Caballeronia TaxID=2646786 RepID=UPI001F2C9B45|nr:MULTISPECIES: ABC transporter ATP-binding protein [unclassified Caballeronia]MCE4547325.1 ABC transporter ATP-binding protein [Caballeronia sp. PC1]MCE4575308.1 ABC transporter ATP-binding protein [Caballeronia sp. CLC5]